MSIKRVWLSSLLVIMAVNTAMITSNSAKARITITVEITNFEFKPAKINVNPGDIVIFFNRDIVPHTATADDGSWETGNIASGESKSIIISEDMALSFYCFYHQAMKGNLVNSG